MKDLSEALGELKEWVDWERELIDDFHVYAQRFQFRPGANVFQCVLEDALRYRGLTLAQLRGKEGKAIRRTRWGVTK
jgi:hypothetical protein